MVYTFRKNIYKSLILFFCLIMISKGYCEGKPGTSITLSLKEAITAAFKNNKDIQMQEQELEVAKAQILGSRSQFLPKVNVGASYTHTGDILSLGSSLSSGLKKDIGVFTGYKNDNKLGVTIDESIYNGGANIANFRQAKLGLKAPISPDLGSRRLD